MKLKIFISDKDKKGIIENYFTLKKQLNFLSKEIKELEIIFDKTTYISSPVVALIYKTCMNKELKVIVKVTNERDYNLLKFLGLDKFIKIIFSKTH